MKILVFVNHVPDTETKVKVSGDGKTIDPGGVNFMLNPYDEYAVEEGLRLREKFKGEVVAVSLGGETHKETLRKALAMGCDKAVLLKDSAERDSFAVARGLADFAKEFSPDIILCGKQSIDYDDAQVGGLVAEMLAIPSVSVVVKLEIEGKAAVVEREIEGGREVVRLRLPAVIAAQKGLNQPRYPSLKGIMEAKRKVIDERNPAPAEIRVRVSSMRNPPPKSAGKVVGTDASAAGELVRLLHTEAKVL
ncbi:MAG TPA: electron transfer flavoprotein subunit beta/FixA family protein [Bacteroidota bacterium]|nr:electron transfer flavoprotein subunit beta/FixA family protein [Bacteroidota bacterium]